MLIFNNSNLLSLRMAVHVVTKRTRRGESDYYIYTKKWNSTVIVMIWC